MLLMLYDLLVTLLIFIIFIILIIILLKLYLIKVRAKLFIENNLIEILWKIIPIIIANIIALFFKILYYLEKKYRFSFTIKNNR